MGTSGEYNGNASMAIGNWAGRISRRVSNIHTYEWNIVKVYLVVSAFGLTFPNYTFLFIPMFSPFELYLHIADAKVIAAKKNLF